MIPAPERVPATPFELKLATELDIEFQRFSNKWLFPWHKINQPNRAVDVEDFKGGRIYLGGICFDDQPQQIYWEAIGRYLSLKSHEVMEKWDADTRGYPARQRASSLDRSAGLLSSFVGRIVQKSLETDRALRGRGKPMTDTPLHARRQVIVVRAEIARIADAHRSLLSAAQPPFNKDVTMASADDFRTQVQHEGTRALARIDQALKSIEAKRAAEGTLISGPTIAYFSKAIVLELENYLEYVTAEIATFANIGVKPSVAIEVASDCLSNLQDKIKDNHTLNKIEKACGGSSPRKHLDEQLSKFDEHKSVRLARVRLGLPSTLGQEHSLPKATTHDVFLSHASEDKEDFADAFADALKKRGLEVWYDTYSMEWGKPTLELLDKGLANSRFGVVVLSPTFFKKDWTQAELGALLNLETVGGNQILPILHKLTHSELVNLSPIISGRFARDTAKATVDELADELATMCAKQS